MPKSYKSIPYVRANNVSISGTPHAITLISSDVRFDNRAVYIRLCANFLPIGGGSVFCSFCLDEAGKTLCPVFWDRLLNVQGPRRILSPGMRPEACMGRLLRLNHQTTICRRW